MARKEFSDRELMKLIGVDAKTLGMFRRVRDDALREAKALAAPKGGKLKVLGISGSARDRYDMSREDSNSEELLRRCLKHCERMGAETEILPLRKYRIEHCKACYSTTNTQCHFYCSCHPKGKPGGDDMTNVIYDKLLSADAIIFATPVNNFKISTLMAAFIDRCISMDGSLMPADPNDPKNLVLNKKHMRFIELTADPDVPGTGMLRRFPGKVAGIIVSGHEAGAAMTISNLFMTLNHYGMLFPPFSNMYAMNSICNSTYSDKETVLSDCYDEEVRVVAKNVMAAAKALRKQGVRTTDWSYDNSKN